MEDVRFLKEHGQTESYLFFVDSNQRDKHIHPNPNEYMITFDSPFKNVYSVEVLDASIPRTQYSVDYHNNSFCYEVDEVETTIYLDIGDYTNGEFINHFNGKTNNVLKISDVSFPSTIRNTFVITSDNEFKLIMKKSSIRSSLGFNEFPNKTESTLYTSTTHDYDIREDNNSLNIIIDNRNYTLRMPPNVYTHEDFINSLTILFNTYNISTTLIKDDLLQLESTVYFSLDMAKSSMRTMFCIRDNCCYTSVMKNNKYTFRCSITKNLRVEQDFVSVLNTDYYDTFGLFSDISANDDENAFPVLPGNVLYQQLPTQEEDVLFMGVELNIVASESVVQIDFKLVDSNYDVVVSGTTTSNTSIVTWVITNSAEYQLDRDEVYFVYISSNSTFNVYSHLSTTTSVLYVKPSITMSSELTRAYVYVQSVSDMYAYSDDVNLSISLNIQCNVSKRKYSIVAPGMYSLIGDRYVLLRSKEIEDHLYRHRANEKYSIGLAKFKLSTTGYDETSLDYTRLPQRTFHPIGKLDKISFSFQRIDGSLYNFRGLNHTITLSIHYYTVEQKNVTFKSTLNPNYNPDFMQYQIDGFNREFERLL
jgi:hypothetical protein